MHEYVEKSALNIFIAEDTTKGHYAECADGSEVVFTHREVSQMIANCPAADVLPVVRGKWLGVWWSGERAFGQCSSCHNTGELRTTRTEYGIWEINMRFCPDCGAAMR